MPKVKTIADVQRKTYNDRKTAGLCPRCATKLRAADRDEGHSYCGNCRDYLAERARERAEGKYLRLQTGESAGMTPSQRWKMLRDQAVAAGKCSLCLARTAGPGALLTCATCRERRAAQKKAR